MVGLIDGVGRVFMLAAGVLLLAGLGAQAGDWSVSNGQMTAVRAHCTHFAKNNKRIGAAPEIFCGCLVNAVRSTFDASGQKIVLTAMAATPANDKGEWHWMTSRKFVDTARAQHYTDKQKHAFSGHLQTILRTEMPRCAIAEGSCGGAGR